MTLSDPVATILAALVVVIGGAVAYWNQKRLDQNRHLVELRRQAYQRFVEAMISTTSAEARNLDRKDDAFEEFQKASAQMSIVASDQVLRCLSDFQLDRSKSSLSIANSSQALLRALRQDVFEGSAVSGQTLENAFPIKFGDRR